MSASHAAFLAVYPTLVCVCFFVRLDLFLIRWGVGCWILPFFLVGRRCNISRQLAEEVAKEIGLELSQYLVTA